MGLTIKNDETHRLGRELANLTGESMTVAVTVAIRERLQRERARRDQGTGLAERLLAIGKDSAAHLRESYRFVEHGELLYDERGLPR